MTGDIFSWYLIHNESRDSANIYLDNRISWFPRFPRFPRNRIPHLETNTKSNINYTRFSFDKQPVYKQLAQGRPKNKQLSGLRWLT